MKQNLALLHLKRYNIKIMKHIFYTLIFSTLAPLLLTAQSEYRLNKSSGTLKLMSVAEVEIVGYQGNEVIFINTDRSEDEDNRAKGLKVFTADGLSDNSGIGLHVEQNGDAILVKEVDGGDCCGCQDAFTIKVPQQMNIFYEYTNNSGDDVIIDNVSGEIELSVNHNDIYLTNVTGPMSVKSVHGDIEVIFTSLKQSNPVSLSSVHGHIDVSVPKSTKANLKVSTNYGSLYSDLDVKVIRKDVTGENSHGVEKSKKIDASINGGGVDMILSSRYEDIYVRGNN